MREIATIPGTEARNEATIPGIEVRNEVSLTLHEPLLICWQAAVGSLRDQRICLGIQHFFHSCTDTIRIIIGDSLAMKYKRKNSYSGTFNSSKISPAERCRSYGHCQLTTFDGSMVHTSTWAALFLINSVADPDPYDFWPPAPGPGSFIQRYGSGSGSESFYRQAKLVRKTSIPSGTVLWLFILEKLCKCIFKK